MRLSNAQLCRSIGPGNDCRHSRSFSLLRTQPQTNYLLETTSNYLFSFAGQNLYSDYHFQIHFGSQLTAASVDLNDYQNQTIPSFINRFLAGLTLLADAFLQRNLPVVFEDLQSHYLANRQPYPCYRVLALCIMNVH